MLIQLSVKNLALIDEIHLNFDKGLNILTGETGAGKSIIIDAVNLVLGERADRDMIQTGKDFARVEALFYIENPEKIESVLNEFGIDPEPDNTLLLMREISLNGRNICRINGRTVTLSIHREISKYLVDIHGQHQHQSLLDVKYHRDLLDMLGGDKIQEIKSQVTKLYKEWKEIQKRIDKLSDIDKNGERRKDILKHQINEIESANLKEGEEEELMQQRTILYNAEKITRVIHAAYENLYSGTGIQPSVSDVLGSISNEVSQISDLDPFFANISKRLEDIFYQLEDTILEIRNYKEQFDFDSSQLEEIERRIELIQSLKRKYGSSIQEITRYRETLENELNELENSQNIIAELKEKETNVFGFLLKACHSLHQERCKVARTFEEQVQEQIKELGMEKAHFKVFIDPEQYDLNDIESIRNKVSPEGYDWIEFMISTNPGEPLKPLAKIVSGGEMSRIMLAFKTILAEVDEIPTLIFDEIDVGISGKIAHVVGEKMGAISRSRQVICVTHLPQIAAMADNHYRIEKKYIGETTRTFVTNLDKNSRKEEIARMIGGKDITPISLEHAKELLLTAYNYKKAL